MGFLVVVFAAQKRRLKARSRAVVALVAVALTGLSLALGPAASAVPAPRVYMPDPGATCWAGATSASFRVRTPVIFGIDYRTGYGNDAQWVRFRSRVVDNATGATYVPGSWSAFSLAYDNLSAGYSGEQSISAPRLTSWPTYHQFFRIAVDVEWWSGSQRLYASTIGVGRYYVYTDLGNLGWGGPGVFTRC